METTVKTLSLFDAPKPQPQFPQTRYQGSKRKLVDWILHSLAFWEFDTVLDAFAGTTAMSWGFKRAGKQVTCNDYLQFNTQIGKAIIENSHVTVSSQRVEEVLSVDSHFSYQFFISETFRDVYFYEDENRWLDYVVQNIERVPNLYERAILWSALGQACIIKRPFNLFHRRNLYVRSAEVKRSFGNKVTWDKPFDEYLRKFVDEFNTAVFDNGRANLAVCTDVFELDAQADLVYLDPPYMNSDGVSVDYQAFYHFLEGLLDYAHWRERIDWESKHLRLRPRPNVWNTPKEIHSAFRRLFEKFHEGIIVVSYRADGIPSVDELREMLAHYKPNVALRIYEGYQYALNPKASDEILLIGF